MKLLRLRLHRQVGSCPLLQQPVLQQQQRQPKRQQQQQQPQFFFGRPAAAPVSRIAASGGLQPQQQQLLQLQQQQQQQRQRAGPRCAALASAAAAFCVAAAGSRREVKLGELTDFPEGGLYEVSVNEGKDKVLVAHVDGAFYCTSSSCPHYGAPLAKGVATADHVTCPWHDAKFDLKTGKCIAGPVTQGIQTFPVQVKGSSLFASLPERLEEHEHSISCCRRRETAFKDKTFVVVGGGPAASAAVEELRAQGFEGRLVMISRENVPPYDRVMLSKNLKCEPNNILLRPVDFLTDTLKVELRLGETVEAVDADAMTVKTDKGNVINYDKLLLCTGSKVRRLQGVEGAEASGVFYLRSLGDLLQLRDSLFSDVNTPQALKHVVVGSSFIGLEVAAALKKVGVRDVAVVGREKVPLELVLGERVGGAFKNLLEANGVEFIPNMEASEIITRDGKVTGVRLKSGRVLAADRVIVGIGVVPELPHISSSKQLQQGNRGGLAVDPFLSCPSHPTIFAAGDIASFPYVKSGEDIRVEHFATAMDQGRVAAANMLGLNRPFAALPFFWTMLFGKGLRYIGNGHGFEDVIVEGDLSKFQFVAYYTKGDKVIAAATMGKDPACVAIGEALKANIMPTAAELRMGLQNSQDIINRVKQNAIKKVA